MSGLLLCLAILRVQDMSFAAWCALYADLPSKQMKIPVSDKSTITCSDDEKRAETPAELQPALDRAMLAAAQGRCFVRPSGTEDCVRIYAEAATQEEADKLAEDACLAVRQTVR